MYFHIIFTRVNLKQNFNDNRKPENVLFSVFGEKLENCQTASKIRRKIFLKEFQIPPLHRMNSTFLTFPLYILELSAKIWP